MDGRMGSYKPCPAAQKSKSLYVMLCTDRVHFTVKHHYLFPRAGGRIKSHCILQGFLNVCTPMENKKDFRLSVSRSPSLRYTSAYVCM